MQAKNVLYAAVGAQVVVARKVSDQVSAFSGRVSEETANYTKTAEKTIDGWASEGEKFVNKVSEGKVAEEISSKVDLDQAKEQVSKLRAQLEDMLATWRSSFRPEKAAEVKESVKPSAKTTAAKKPAAKKPATKKPATKKPAAKSTATKKPAAKKPAAKGTAAKRPAAKSSATKTTTAAKKPAAKTS